MTCHYRCGDACAQPVPNTSGNPYFGDVVNDAMTRRTVLKAGGVGAAAVGLAWGAATPAAARPGGGGGRPGLAGFTPISPTPADVDAVVVPKGYTWAPIISWGDPVEPGAPEFDFWNQTSTAQLGQAGYNADYVTLMRGGRPTWPRGAPCWSSTTSTPTTS